MTKQEAISLLAELVCCLEPHTSACHDQDTVWSGSTINIKINIQLGHSNFFSECAAADKQEYGSASLVPIEFIINILSWCPWWF